MMDIIIDAVLRLRLRLPAGDGYGRLGATSSESWGWADLHRMRPAPPRLPRLPRRQGHPPTAPVRPPQARQPIRRARASATFLLTIFLVILVLEVTGASVYYAEAPDPNANITTAGDAIWWGLVTITTVGYGDQYPVTELGRIIGTFLLFAGIALFSVLTGFIANAFLAPPSKPRLQATRPSQLPRSRTSGPCWPSRTSGRRRSARTSTSSKSGSRTVAPRPDQIEGVKPA